MPVPIVYDDCLSKYTFPGKHPFQGSRFPKFLNYFKSTSAFRERLAEIVGFSPPPPTEEDLLLVHTKSYIEKVKRICSRGWGYLDLDTPLTEQMFSAAICVVHSSLTAGKLVYEDHQIAIGIGGGLHHASKDRGGGFCVFNDVAILARKMQSLGFKKVFIFDYDAHCGDGTMEIFYDDPSVFFFSVHQDPNTLYPGTGFPNQIGEGDGEGFTCNVPLPPGSGRRCYEAVINELFLPLIEQFKPDILICNGGCDPHHSDPLTALNLDLNGFNMVGRKIREIGLRVCGKIVDLICSGYNEQVLPEAWSAIIYGLLGLEGPRKEEVQEHDTILSAALDNIREVKRFLKPYWDI